MFLMLMRYRMDTRLWCLVTNLDGLDGGGLDCVCRNPDASYYVSDELLRWHFRKSVIGNGEPSFEHDWGNSSG
ncbi:hypothetical protein BDZ91DRAFT_708273 [Kalaharituber pfeilii]|nr:hypothetical protein BDZ91DRAFT_708273 [Kalaharituber pfeilii]